MSIRIDLTIVVGDDIAVDVLGDVTEASEKAIAFKIIECKKHPFLVGGHHVVHGPSLTQVLRALGYSHEPGDIAGARHVFVTKCGTYKLRNKRAHEVWAWIKAGAE